MVITTVSTCCNSTNRGDCDGGNYNFYPWFLNSNCSHDEDENMYNSDAEIGCLRDTRTTPTEQGQHLSPVLVYFLFNTTYY